MKSIIHNILTLSISIVGFIGGIFWCIQSNWEYEPIIVALTGGIGIIAYFFIPKADIGNTKQNQITAHAIGTSSGKNSLINNNGNNNQNNQIDIQILTSTESNQNLVSHISSNDKNSKIDEKKNKISILFIDDDKNFNIVKILKDSGWKNTKTVVDVKTIDDPNIKNAEIIFVDINGVGKVLNLPHEGLDLALMIKQKYESKKVIIYSANNYNNAFHEAWNIADSRLEKNALPYQFQSLVERYSLEYYNN